MRAKKYKKMRSARAPRGGQGAFGQRAQVAFEYLVITGFLLLIAAILFGFSLFSFNENSRVAQAQEAVNRISANADLVASLGEGSRVYFEITVPNGTDSLELFNKTVAMRMDAGGGFSDIIAYAKPNLTPVSLNTGAGRYTLSAYFIDGNVAVS